ncbi:hypothetical protein [Methylibium petroleiphilum]
MSERERFEAWARTQPRHEGASMRFLPLNNAYIDFDLHGAWLAWQAARSGQAASGSSQGARSDDQTEVEQFNAWFAALTFEKLGSDSMEWAAWKARATLVGQPEAPTAAPTKAAEDAHPAYWPEFPPFPTWIDANDLATLHEWAQTVRRDAFAAGLQRAAIAAHPPARSGAGSEEGQG